MPRRDGNVSGRRLSRQRRKLRAAAWARRKARDTVSERVRPDLDRGA